LALVSGEALISKGRRASSESVVEWRNLPFCVDHRFQCVTAAGSPSFILRRKSASGTAANESTTSAQNDISEECRLRLYLLADPGGRAAAVLVRASFREPLRPSVDDGFVTRTYKQRRHRRPPHISVPFSARRSAVPSLHVVSDIGHLSAPCVMVALAGPSRDLDKQCINRQTICYASSNTRTALILL
jgi:hypothetical protein